MKGLFIIIGESFRFGGQGSRSRGIPESYNEQLLACKSHIKFFNDIKNEVDIELSVLTYETQYQNDLIKCYSDFNARFHFYKDTIGFDKIFNEGLSKVELKSNYDFIFVFRIDLFFKFNFFNKIKKDKINYSSVCWMNSPNLYIKHRNKTIKGKHRVVDVMIYTPEKYIKNLLNGEIKLDHNACDLMSNDLYNNVDFILDTYHDSDSQKDKNPIYKIVNRPESDIWHSEGYKLGIDPIMDQSKTYEKIFKI